MRLHNVNNGQNNDLFYSKLMTQFLEFSDANVSAVCGIAPSTLIISHKYEKLSNQTQT